MVDAYTLEAWFPHKCLIHNEARNFDCPCSSNPVVTHFAISLQSSSSFWVSSSPLSAMKSLCSCSAPTSSTSFPAFSSSSSPRNWKKDLHQPGIVVVKVYSHCKISSSFQFVRSSRIFSVSRFRNPAIRSEKTERTPLYCTSTSRPQVKELIEFLVRKSSSFVVEWSQLNLMKLIAFLAFTFMVIPSSEAVDALKTCTCLLKECRVELAKCIANPLCAANVACLQTCNNRPDETECQIKCGDLFENKVVDEFNECAVSRKKCVPRKSDVGEFPVPDPSVLVKSFKISDFEGKWYITSGLNPVFDVFDCQLHEFHVESDKLTGNITWRIKTPDGGFFTRSTMQRFVQDPNQPGVLYNHDNEYLHYQDDWYILSSKVEQKPDDYIFVYYRGRNDAWDGYGGAVVYTRSAVLPESIIPELEKSAKNVGRDFSKFIRTDNTCGPEPPLVERLEKKLEDGERVVIKEVEEIEQEVEKEVEIVEKTEKTLLQRLAEGIKKLKKDEDYILRELSKEEMDLLNELKMEASEVESLFGKTLPLRKLR